MNARWEAQEAAKRVRLMHDTLDAEAVAHADAASDVWEPLLRSLMTKMTHFIFLVGGHPDDVPEFVQAKEALGDDRP